MNVSPYRHPIPENKSFIDTRQRLKDADVMHYDFFTRYKNPSLRYIDPFYDQTLTNEDINSIVSECSINIWYFLRHIVRVPDLYTTGINLPGTRKPVCERTCPKMIDIKPFELNLSNLASIYCAVVGISNYVVTPMGIPSLPGIHALYLWELLFRTGKDIVLNDTYFSGHDGFTMLKCMARTLPTYILHSLRIEPTRIVNRWTGRACYLSPYTISKDNSDNIKSENSNKISLYTNFEIIPVNVDLISFPKEKGYNMFISPIGDRNSKSGANAYKYVNDCMRWKDMYYDLPIINLKKSLVESSLNGCVYIQHNFEELGKDVKWASDVAKLNHLTPEEVSRKIYLNRDKPRCH